DAEGHVDAALRESQRRFRAVFDSMFQLMGVLTPDGTAIDVNGAALRFAGLEAKDVIGRKMWETQFFQTTPQTRELARTAVQRAAAGELVRAELEILGAGGRTMAVDFSIKPVYDDAGRVTMLVPEGRDISERRQLDSLLFAEKERVRVALSSITDAVLITDIGGRVEFINPVAERLAGLTPQRVVGRHVADAIDLRDEDPRRPLEVLLALPGQHESFVQGTAHMHRADAPPIVVDYALAPLKDAAGEPIGYVVTLHDVTQARALTRALEHQATHDALTGLLNRSGLERALEKQRLLADGREWCLLYLDLDRFKTVNDTAGHAVGDELLRALAIRLRSVLRATDTFARLGGDEFGIILDECGVEHAERLATKLIDAVDRFRFRLDDEQFQLGLSIGIARGAGAQATTADLLRMADTACYVAKRTGRNRACVYNDSAIEGVAASAEFDSLHRLQRALDQDRLCVYAQKIVDIGSAAPVGIELLLRMVGPDGAIVEPSQFLAVAERHDVITRLDSWMLARAAHLLRGVSGRLPDGWFVTINVSGLSISDPRFHRTIAEVIDGDRMLRDRIYFEITESTAPSNWAVTRQGIELLRSHGSRVLLDDFGSGFTSFNYLRNLSVDGLKIAQDFTQNMHCDRINEPVVSLVAELTQRFNICAIAEGIEDDAARQLVAGKRVKMAQGFHFHRPEPVENLLR
ncbi:MAG: putative bifunctional diguanylate cyclase/phosphodiesterase, partial [Gammaproteobacteria bacterium]